MSESTALKALYDATGGASWTNSTNWGVSNSAEDWYGVDVLDGHVYRLTLNNNNLNGSLTSWTPNDLPMLEDLFLQDNASLTGDISDWDLSALTHLEAFYIYSTGVSGDISSWTFPATMVLLSVSNTSVSGDISGWTFPSILQSVSVSNTSVSGNIGGWTIPSFALFMVDVIGSGVTGDISGWVVPAPLKYLYIGETVLTGVPDLSAMASIQLIAVHDCGLAQAAVDAWLAAIYARRASMTYATPALLIGGTNAAPSGAYADEDPPTTGNGYIYELENDPEAEGFNVWNISNS